MIKLMIVTVSTRPTRQGPSVARWFEGLVRSDGRFEIDPVDLAELGLPFMDEPEHPRFGRYVHEHTKAWSARVDAADAFVFVMPEYNYGFTAPLKNALDYLAREWRDKPLGFVSYGGVAAGTRAVQLLKPVVTALKLVPANEAVHIPFFSRFIDEDGVFHANQELEAGARAMLDELVRLDGALRPLRQSEWAGR
jgi:NAD(P)H-dependent FMN reductase